MNIFEKTFKKLFDLPCWGISHIRYMKAVTLWMDFGQPRLEVVEHKDRRSASPRGKWCLFIWPRKWGYFVNNEFVARQSSSETRICKVRASLTGQKLIRVKIDIKKGNTEFIYDLGGELKVFTYKSDDKEELWRLYKPSGYVLSVSSDGTFSHEPSSGLDLRKPTVDKKLTELSWFSDGLIQVI